MMFHVRSGLGNPVQELKSTLAVVQASDSRDERTGRPVI